MPSIDFCQMVAETITGDANQHATMMITATTGAGKSEAGLAIAERVSQIVAEIKGGYPEDYFTVDNVAIMTEKEIMRVLVRMNHKKFHCFGFDDIGAYSWGSRNFMTENNQQLNGIFQTFRTQNNFLYLTLPNDSLVDVVARRLTKYHMKITMSHFDYGYVEAKIYKPIKDSKLPHGGIEPFLVDLDGRKIKRHIVFRSSKALRDEYEARRAKIESENTGLTIDDMIQASYIESNPPEPRDSKRKILSYAVKADYGDGTKISMNALAEKYHVSSKTIFEALHYEEPKSKGILQQQPEPKKI